MNEKMDWNNRKEKEFEKNKTKEKRKQMYKKFEE